MAAVKKTEEERIKELGELTPELPKNFKEWCGEKFLAPEIYYKRKGNFANAPVGNAAGNTKSTHRKIWNIEHCMTRSQEEESGQM